METLEAWDRALVLFVNGWHRPWLDEIMWIISGKITWIPLYLLLFYVGFKSFGRKGGMLFIFCAVISVGLADFTAAQIIKESVQRYRPSHHELLKPKLHFYRMSNGEFYLGGQFGFVSNHATNFFAVLAWVLLVFWDLRRKIAYAMIIVTFFVCLSRIYLGVHYLSDIVGGAIVGTAISLLVYQLIYVPKKQKLA